MSDYKKVDILTYVRDGIKNGLMIPKKAEKYKKIMAHQGKVGDVVISWSVDSNGNEIKEKIAHVKLDKNTNQPGWIVVKLDSNDEVLIDSNGHINSWIIDDSTFKEKYEKDLEEDDIYKPVSKSQTFVQIDEDIILNQWGMEMKIAKGGYINITDVDNMYGISKRDFDDTYKFSDEIKYNKVK